jgi:hypothetical protein
MLRMLTQAELNREGCGIDGCGHDHSILYLASRCHMGAGLEASYEKATGILTMRCKRCKAPVTEILVAAGRSD